MFTVPLCPIYIYIYIYICTYIRRDSDYCDNDYNQSIIDNGNTNEIPYLLLFVYMNNVFTTVFTVSKIAIFGILQSINQQSTYQDDLNIVINKNIFNTYIKALVSISESMSKLFVDTS